MYIQTEKTPNPDAIKFLPGFNISPENPIYFKGKIDCSNSSLALKLISIENIEAVFFGYDFITMTKSTESSWDLLKPDILVTIMDHFTSGLTAFDNIKKQQIPKIDIEHLPEIEKQIIEIIENKVRPAVAMDGGDIMYVGFDNGIVTLRLQGACSGCPSSNVTLKNGIESMLKHYIPEIIEVVAENEIKNI
jgi:Fe-S cluster biogenesis protein NfuA